MMTSFLKRLAVTVIFSFYGFLLIAQPDDSTSKNINDVMISHEKIYVVMAVCVTILIVLFLYLIRIDVKVSKKEKHS